MLTSYEANYRKALPSSPAIRGIAHPQQNRCHLHLQHLMKKRPVPPVKRVMKQRHPFDIYQDQYESLQHLALEERKQGGVGSMSAMVREALDKLIAERKKEKKG